MTIAAFLNGVGDAKRDADDRKDRKRELDLYEAAMGRRQLPGMATPPPGGGPMPVPGGPRGYATGGGTGGGGGGGGGHYEGKGTAARMKTADPVADDLPPHARAFLNAIAHGESAGAYNIRYTPGGGQTFELTDQHPRIFEPGPHGRSSAAGRYQFTATTWDDVGGGAFTPYNQDHEAWGLARARYRATTGGDLDAVLQSDGFTPGVMKALAPTWAAFGNSGKYGDYRATYDESYSRYQPTTAPAAAPAVESSPLPAAAPAAAPAAQPAQPLLPAAAPRRSITPQGPVWGWTRDLQMGT